MSRPGRTAALVDPLVAAVEMAEVLSAQALDAAIRYRLVALAEVEGAMRGLRAEISILEEARSRLEGR